jgi:HNH endonuclease
MSNSKRPRILRGPSPARKLRNSNLREAALTELLRDFECRCAYSMQHQSRSGALEIDHFDPRLKSHILQDYGNLFLASRHCNNKKGQNWPTREDMLAGARFLNPCLETDYGEHIFENEEGSLVGVSPAGKWHIRMCDLNAPHLVKERQSRTSVLEQLRDYHVSLKKDHTSWSEIDKIVGALRNQVNSMIKEIAPLSVQRC